MTRVFSSVEFQITEKLKTKEMTENYSGRTTFGDIDFTEDQIEEYKLVFAEFDIDGDGNISVQVTENFNDLNKNLGIYRKSFRESLLIFKVMGRKWLIAFFRSCSL